MCSRSPHKILKCKVDGSRIRPAAGKPCRFLQELIIKHKVCTFHVYNITCLQVGVNKLVPTPTSESEARVRLVPALTLVFQAGGIRNGL